MPSRIRYCIECRECHTRYVIGLSPYHNGSYLVSNASGFGNVVGLYCCCSLRTPQELKSAELQTYAVSEWAYKRGYGSPDEIVMVVEKNSRAS
jgi:hypothetical protein